MSLFLPGMHLLNLWRGTYQSPVTCQLCSLRLLLNQKPLTLVSLNLFADADLDLLGLRHRGIESTFRSGISTYSDMPAEAREKYG